MAEGEGIESIPKAVVPFFDQPQVQKVEIPVGKGVPLGVQQVFNPQVGIGGAFGAWGESYDNESLIRLIELRLGEPLNEQERMDLAPLGFVNRHHITKLSPEEDVALEVAVGVRLLQAAAQANGWEPGEVEAVLLGASGPVAEDYVERVASEAGIPESALKVSVHKACDSSMGALQIALNPNLALSPSLKDSVAEKLSGKKVLIGGIEGLSRFIRLTRDKNAMQLFGNGAGVIGVIPGKTMKFLVGKTYEAFDELGVLAVHMYYPHSRRRIQGQSLVEVSQPGPNRIRVAGMMHEPADGTPIAMAGLMGMVKLFVRSGVQVVQDVYGAYRERMSELGEREKTIRVAIVHHANFKINSLKEKHLQNEGIQLNMPWLLSEFGNVSAASNMIAFLRQLPSLRPGDHILFDGFGAGTYYDVLVVDLAGPA